MADQVVHAKVVVMGARSDLVVSPWQVNFYRFPPQELEGNKTHLGVVVGPACRLVYPMKAFSHPYLCLARNRPLTRRKCGVDHYSLQCPAVQWAQGDKHRLGQFQVVEVRK